MKPQIQQLYLLPLGGGDFSLMTFLWMLYSFSQICIFSAIHSHILHLKFSLTLVCISLCLLLLLELTKENCNWNENMDLKSPRSKNNKKGQNFSHFVRSNHFLGRLICRRRNGIEKYLTIFHPFASTKFPVHRAQRGAAAHADYGSAVPIIKYGAPVSVPPVTRVFDHQIHFSIIHGVDLAQVLIRLTQAFGGNLPPQVTHLCWIL